MDTAPLLWGLLFGSVGVAYLMYGRRQGTIVPYVSGLALIVFPYFVSDTLALVATGAALMALPYFLRL